MTSALAERLWLLERTTDLRAPTRDVRRFMGHLRSCHQHDSRTLRSLAEAHAMLNRPSVRFDLERYAVTFATLDDAIRWADEKKHVWMTKGWTEIDTDDAKGWVERSDVTHS